ncbi:hypothetical protein ACH4CC_36635 [Streptomyces lydicus]|uniref:hypothetical protein n=1 Tax=Streptomyces lydicus TaxID=47763 RepID=UPI0037B3C976
MRTTSPREGVVIPYADGHQRQLPCLTAVPVPDHHRAVPANREAVREGPGEAGVGRPVHDEPAVPAASCLNAGAHKVQLDFEEARLSLKLDPSGGVLKGFVDLNNQLLQRLTEEERTRIGVYCSPGVDQGSTHSLDVDYGDLLPQLFRLQAGSFYLPLASEPDPERTLKMTADQLRPGIRVFVGTSRRGAHVDVPR